MKSRLIGALLLLAPTLASAQSMNAEQFHKRATAVQNKGVLAVLSMGEIKALMHEAEAAGAQARDNWKAARKAGKPQRFCPPDAPIEMGDREFMTRLSAIPAQERARIDMTEAMTRILAVKYPCRS